MRRATGEIHPRGYFLSILVKGENNMEYSQEHHLTWETLTKRQLPKVSRYACREYLEGFELLAPPLEHNSSLEHLNARITPRTGWKTVRTAVRYSDAVAWYESFARREFMVTDYRRAWDELDFTPEPDMFHDIFGHLPFMTLPRYTALQDLFAPAFQRATPAQREDIKRLAWFSTEFGLIRESGEIKIFGAGLISSSGEMENVISGTVPVLPFTVENVLRQDKAIWSFNKVLFVFDSLEALTGELTAYFNKIGIRDHRDRSEEVESGELRVKV
jgi:phenylalanine-4-hydroxylase